MVEEVAIDRGVGRVRATNLGFIPAGRERRIVERGFTQPPSGEAKPFVIALVDLRARIRHHDTTRVEATREWCGAIEKSDHRYSEAETILKDALSLPPSPEHDAKVLYVLGRMYDSWGRKDQARVALQKVVKTYGQTSIAQKAKESLGALEK